MYSIWYMVYSIPQHCPLYLSIPKGPKYQNTGCLWFLC